MEIEKFHNDKWSIGRPILAKETWWFSGTDVARSLEYGNPRGALHRHVEPEGKTTYSELVKDVGITDPFKSATTRNVHH